MVCRRDFLVGAISAAIVPPAPLVQMIRTFAPYQILKSAPLEGGGTFREIRFAPEFGTVPVTCYAAIMDRRLYSSAIVEQRTYGAFPPNVGDIARETQAAFAINGGFFFTSPFRPDGLLIVDGKTVSRANPTYEGAFMIDRSGVPSVLAAKDVRNAQYAVQGKPMLVEPGGFMGMKRERYLRDTRTFVAQSGNLIIAGVTSAMTLYHLADVFIIYPFAFGVRAIDAALNLTGSATTGVYARFADGNEYVQDEEWVNRDVIVFKSRS